MPHKDKYYKYIDYNRKYNHDYYESHKDEILKKQSTLIECKVCHMTIRKNNFQRHIQTNKHFHNLEKTKIKN